MAELTDEPCKHSEFIGCYSNGSIHLVEETEQVAMHELGHVLSVGHLVAGNGIMSRDQSTATQCITQSDLDLICEVNECLWEKVECQ